ncbi:MAG: FadR/GntR family transcriptional regulator, partial [Solirubrobacterales bacterium]
MSTIGDGEGATMEHEMPPAGEASTPALASVGAVFRPVTAATAFEETVERLSTAIRLGLLPAGSKLPPERDLAEQLQISRGTLSKAIATLVQSGHIRSLRGRSGGTFISSTPPLASNELDAEWQQLMRWRAGIEIGVASLAAQYATPEEIEDLRAEVDEMKVAALSDYTRYRRADGRFHIALAEASHSQELVVTMTDLQGRITNLLALIAHPAEVRLHANEQ